MRRRATLGVTGLGLGVLLAALMPVPDAHPQAGTVAGIALVMAVFWVFEVLPIPVTSLLPLVLLPLCGVASIDVVAPDYAKPMIFLFLGGLLLAIGLEKTALHRRIALHIVAAIGSRPSRLVLGFMVATAALSMWISNTASVMVMLPIALSVLGEMKQRDAETTAVIGTALMLGIAYAADIGGMATLVGTPPNLAYATMQTELFPAAPRTTFLQWMALGVPVSVVFVLCGWGLLTRVVFKLPRAEVLGDSGTLKSMLTELGPIRRDEMLAGAVFAATALLWVTGSDIALADMTIPGWRSVTGLTGVTDAVVAIVGATLLFALPSADRAGEPLLVWDDAKRVPWGLLLLFGGGFALATGFTESGLSAVIGTWLTGLRGLPVILVTFMVCVVLTFLTELTSNTATTNLVLPILASAAVALEIDPRVLMIPATLSASCAFMMPVASPTQAIVFGSGWVPIREMVRAGIWFNVLGVVLVTIVFFVVGVPVLGIDLGTLPGWAHAAP